jgi:hypothetical protein
MCTLLYPHIKSVKLDAATTTRVVAHLVTRLSQPTQAVRAKDVRQNLPDTVETWGKLQIAEDGDTVCAAAHSKSQVRNASFVRVRIVLFCN